MALTTFEELRTAVALWLARPGDAELSSAIPDMVTLFEAWANRTFRVRQMLTTATLTMTDGVAPLPDDYLQWVDVRWTGSPASSLEQASRSWLTQTYPNSTSSRPGYFSIEGDNILVSPTDDTSLEFRYYAKVPALATGFSLEGGNWLFPAHPDIYLFGTLAEAQAFTQNPQDAMMWKSRRDDIASEIMWLDARADAPAQIRLVGVYTP